MAKVTLTKEQVKRLNALNISAKSDDAARKGIIDLLAQNDVDGMDDEDMDTLLDLAESLIPEGGSAAAEQPETADDSNEESEAEELAHEAEEETEEETETAEESGDEFDGMDRNALKKYIKENGLEVKVFKSDSDDDIRAKIRAAVDTAETAEEAPAAEEEAPKAKKAEKKAPAKKAEKAEKKPTAKRGVKLDPQNNEEDMKTMKDALTELFPEDEFRYDAVKSAGVTIKHKGQNSNRALVLIENCSLQADGSIKCNLYFLTLAKNLEVLDNADISYEKCWSGAPFIKGTTLAEAVEAISAVKEHLTAQVKKIDKRLGENRAKMEEGFSKKSAAAKKEGAENAPAAKKAPAAPAKKTVKKK